jgi:hypothetical protein
MPKKTWIQKEPEKIETIEESSKSPVKKEESQKKVLIENTEKDLIEVKPKKVKNQQQTMVELETLQGQLKKDKVTKGDRLKTKQYDADGNLLTSKGKIDKRPKAGLENLKKSRVYQQILSNKKLKESVGKVAILTPYVESDDSDTEFEEIKLEVEPEVEKLPAVPVMSRTELYLKEQAELREKQLAEQIKKMEDENKKLKDKFQFNSHLNRIQAMSSSVKLKF